MPIYKLVTNFHGQPSRIVDVFLRCWMIKRYTTEIYTKTDGGKCISSLKYGYFLGTHMLHVWNIYLHLPEI